MPGIMMSMMNNMPLTYPLYTWYESTNTNTWTANRISHILVGIKS